MIVSFGNCIAYVAQNMGFISYRALNMAAETNISSFAPTAWCRCCNCRGRSCSQNRNTCKMFKRVHRVFGDYVWTGNELFQTWTSLWGNHIYACLNVMIMDSLKSLWIRSPVRLVAVVDISRSWCTVNLAVVELVGVIFTIWIRLYLFCPSNLFLSSRQSQGIHHSWNIGSSEDVTQFAENINDRFTASVEVYTVEITWLSSNS